MRIRVYTDTGMQGQEYMPIPEYSPARDIL